MEQIRSLIDYLNEQTHKYNRGSADITDKEWDSKYFELKQLEKETGIIYPDSPTQFIYYDVVSSFEKVNLDPPMLSLAKTKDINEVKAFAKDKDIIISLKMDGLSCRLEYDNGELISASTRGTGTVGDLVTTNVKTCKNVPKHVPYLNHLVVDGEIIITAKDFELFANEYKNQRNLAAGSLKLLDSSECAKRNLSFVAWDVIEGLEDKAFLSDKLVYLEELGFTVVPCNTTTDNNIIEDIKDFFIRKAEQLGYPIDGLVIKYDEIKYYRSLGSTSHHPNGGLSLKFYDEEYETTLIDIEWQVGRTGQITPIARFEPVNTGDSIIERASLHNLSVMGKLSGGFERRGDKLFVIKSNMIIPQVIRWEHTDNYSKENHIFLPEVCPICGKPATIKNDTESKFLICSNPDCEGKFINKVENFACKKGLDIKGISKATLEKLMDWGWLNTISDIFRLQEHRFEWIKKSGFGIKSVDNILNAIESSRKCELDKFIAALGIPLIGTSASKALAKHFGTWEAFIEAVDDDFKFYTLPDFGPEAHKAIMNFDFTEAKEIAEMLSFTAVAKPKTAVTLAGLTFVITGKVSLLAKNRDELKAKIESFGGKVAGSVSKNTSYLINNDLESSSSKNLTAKKLGVPIISEKKFQEIFEIS